MGRQLTDQRGTLKVNPNTSGGGGGLYSGTPTAGGITYGLGGVYYLFHDNDGPVGWLDMV
jgi:hypothetical protein